MLFESLQRGRKCRESVARCRDTALIAMLLVGFSARSLLRLDVADLQGLRMPQPVWWAVLAWVRRRASIPGTIECRRLFIHAHCKPLHPRGLYLLLNRRAKRAGVNRPISVLAVRLAGLWGTDELLALPSGFWDLGKRCARRRRFPGVRVDALQARPGSGAGPEPRGVGNPALLPFAAAVELGMRLQQLHTPTGEGNLTGREAVP